jgi:hypothetical protein
MIKINLIFYTLNHFIVVSNHFVFLGEFDLILEFYFYISMDLISK